MSCVTLPYCKAFLRCHALQEPSSVVVVVVVVFCVVVAVAVAGVAVVVMLENRFSRCRRLPCVTLLFVLVVDIVAVGVSLSSVSLPSVSLPSGGNVMVSAGGVAENARGYISAREFLGGSGGRSRRRVPRGQVYMAESSK